ncbi:beta-carotene hydroxylase 2, chloroplastic isoform X2 [Amborella trichopoda]|uniref:beta-carotene hydroxylase 2, chloroplastic isoform X2 n=1 Tax=Amborella trichopoda TaxID=13333 RepID=UPI0009BDC0BB|nr:beta-carotene hydroxylase 2, chloroplastic isoform X2 [Amborella trichopoda]|eukprot:XP_020530176.1 beta-carotene hydroxylase 2, chloroplastic isoform X2 [Amborella trichopoda]
MNTVALFSHKSFLSPHDVFYRNRGLLSKKASINGGCLMPYFHTPKHGSVIKAQKEGVSPHEEKVERRKREKEVYLFAAIASSFGISTMAAGSVYYRFYWQMEGGDVPGAEMFGTFALALGAAVGMEHWARWAHRALWHSSLWHMHEGLGITIFGMAYMFVHDGLVHRRFPVGPIENVPYLKKVAAAHQLHHADNFNGVPYGLFLGPKELEEVGGSDELERLVNSRNKAS